MNNAPLGMNIDYALLKRQAKTIGDLAERPGETPTVKEHMRGLWEFLHAVLDRRDQGNLTVRVTLEGGIIQNIDMPPGITVKVYDYDAEAYHLDELMQDDDGNDCHVSVWEG